MNPEERISLALPALAAVFRRQEFRRNGLVVGVALICLWCLVGRDLSQTTNSSAPAHGPVDTRLDSETQNDDRTSLPVPRLPIETSQRLEDFQQSQLAQLPKLGFHIGNERDVSVLLHLLLYGGYEETGLEYPKTGTDALDILTNDELCIQYFGSSVILPTRYGLRYHLPVLQAWTSNLIGESHRDQCLGVFAKLDLPLDYPISVRGNRYSLKDLLSDSVANFTLEQAELSWTLYAYAKYLPPSTNWTNKFGKNFCFDDVVDKLLATELYKASCAGVHVFESLLMLERVDHTIAILRESTRLRLRSYLQSLRLAASKNLNADGSWDTSWFLSKRPNNHAQPSDTYTKLVVTGHLTELLVSSNIDAKVIAQPARWLLRELTAEGPHDPRISVCPMTHALVSVRLSLENRRVLREMYPFLSEFVEKEPCIE